MSNHEKAITELVLSAVEPMPLDRRADFYGHLAALVSDDQLDVNLGTMADELRKVAHSHRQLVLNFQRRTEG